MANGRTEIWLLEARVKGLERRVAELERLPERLAAQMAGSNVRPLRPPHESLADDPEGPEAA